MREIRDRRKEEERNENRRGRFTCDEVEEKEVMHTSPPHRHSVAAISTLTLDGTEKSFAPWNRATGGK
jgi:hypothetical protein